ncbi:LCP family protein [Streptomyces hainanensis]|uniref:LytR family transcriptional regulator n=1 Tax=Streptomyces hainanensis TaxID=402648 RepID=A0A4R4TV47_9ACTN|nr:LCP family protein [Streptomyces hainanensis]TDC79914.1 LytR family transcriptional regulator [Streptomyces hainanensis]
MLWWLLLAFGALLAIAAGTALWAFHSLEGNIRTDHAATRELDAHAAERPHAGTGKARNVLVIGEDFGSGTGNARSDTVLLLHLSGDGERAEAVNVPRDIVVDIPGCRTPDGTTSEPQHAQFNWAFQFGGAACTIRTFEQLAGVRVDHHVVVGFEGFADIVDAVGGVEVELAQDEHDPNVGHDLSAGRHLLDGEQALAYVRARVYVGDGSDLNRLLRQQEFLGRVYEKVTTQGTLANPAKLYPVLAAVTSSITADPGLDSLDALSALVADLRAVPDRGVTFHTVPTVPHPERPNRLTLDQQLADELFADLLADRPLPERA